MRAHGYGVTRPGSHPPAACLAVGMSAPGEGAAARVAAAADDIAEAAEEGDFDEEAEAREMEEEPVWVEWDDEGAQPPAAAAEAAPAAQAGPDAPGPVVFYSNVRSCLLPMSKGLSWVHKYFR